MNTQCTDNNVGMLSQRVLICIQEVIKRTGLCRSSIYAMMEAGAFPKSVRIGKRAVRWVESEIDEFIGQKIEARAAQEKPRALQNDGPDALKSGLKISPFQQSMHTSICQNSASTYLKGTNK